MNSIKWKILGWAGNQMDMFSRPCHWNNICLSRLVTDSGGMNRRSRVNCNVSDAEHDNSVVTKLTEHLPVLLRM